MISDMAAADVHSKDNAIVELATKSGASQESSPCDTSDARELAIETTKTDCRLLNLCAELRNRIYKFALCEGHKIKITKHNFAEPAILGVYKQIRNEARGLYYTANRFNIDALDFDSAVITHLCSRLPITSDGGELDHCFELGYSPRSWANLMGWLKAYHHNRKKKHHKWMSLRTEMKSSRNARQRLAVTGAFAIVGGLQDANVKWEVVEKMLLIHKASTAECMRWR
jgi:hypothetical protein